GGMPCVVGWRLPCFRVPPTKGVLPTISRGRESMRGCTSTQELCQGIHGQQHAFHSSINTSTRPGPVGGMLRQSSSPRVTPNALGYGLVIGRFNAVAVVGGALGQ